LVACSMSPWMHGCLLKFTLDAWLPAEIYLGCMVICWSLPWMHGCLLKFTLDAWLRAQCTTYHQRSIRQTIRRNKMHRNQF
jgi:hypothetical protein